MRGSFCLRRGRRSSSLIDNADNASIIPTSETFNLCRAAIAHDYIPQIVKNSRQHYKYNIIERKDIEIELNELIKQLIKIINETFFIRILEFIQKYSARLKFRKRIKVSDDNPLIIFKEIKSISYIRHSFFIYRYKIQYC